MISKSKISQIRLFHQKKHREAESTFIVEGTKSYFELQKSQLDVIEIYATEKWISENPLNSEEKNKIQLISDKEMEKISCLTTAPEILCLVKTPYFSVNQFDNNKPIIVLDDIKDPGNLGTIIRTADWFGINQILCSENSVEFTNPKTIQATMGSFCRVTMVYGDILNFISTHSNRVSYGMFMDGFPIDKQNFSQNDILVIGSESHGISSEVATLIQQKITIPHFHNSPNTAESLNASIASGILLYEYGKKLKN